MIVKIQNLSWYILGVVYSSGMECVFSIPKYSESTITIIIGEANRLTGSCSVPARRKGWLPTTASGVWVAHMHWEKQGLTN